MNNRGSFIRARVRPLVCVVSVHVREGSSARVLYVGFCENYSNELPDTKGVGLNVHTLGFRARPQSMENIPLQQLLSCE